MPRHSTRASARLLVFVLAGGALAACASNPDPELEPDAPVRIAPPTTPIKYGDCPEARRRASADRELFVDKLPAPRAKESSAIPVKSMPAAVRSAKYSEIRASVLVDTLGHADMSTFTVVKTTHPWLATSVKSALARWRFEPAEVAGCKVPRLYNYNLHSGKR
jgi:hypothetical protein